MTATAVAEAATARGLPRKEILLPIPYEQMRPAVRKMWDTYRITPGAPLYRAEFGYYCMDEWKQQGMPQNVPHHVLFNYDKGARHDLGQLGWCEAAFAPCFETKIVEDRGEYEVVQDYAGRKVLYFKGRRNGSMAEYLDHPVKDQKTWEQDVKWRMNPATPERFKDLEERMQRAQAAAREGKMVVQGLIGGYMYLRSLMGPQDLLYAVYDQPELIHDCMKTWLRLADAVIARHQQYVTIDEIFFAEDICYNHGPLISPEMMREFITPYYQEIIRNLKARQLDKRRHVFVQIDTDGLANPVIPVYMETIGMDVMSPFEVASGCDVVAIGRQYPDLVMKGGIDKRILAQGRAAIDRHLEYILPAMRARGGYIPTCDHGVPAEVPYQDYLYYRQRCVELGG
jgi:uroporphyrinogen-III decarboxylase